MKPKPIKKHFEIHLETFAIKDLKPHPENPRKHPVKGSPEWETLKASLSDCYFDPVVVNKKNGLLVSGHLRSKIMADLGAETASAVIINVDEKKHLALLMGANNQAGVFDYPRVTKLLKQIKKGGGDSQLLFTGFGETEVKDLLKGSFEVVVEPGPGRCPPGGSTPEMLTAKISANPSPVHAMTEGEYDRLRKSIQSGGILNPLLLRRKGKEHYVIDGNQRLKAALELGLDSVPVRVIGGITDEQSVLMTYASNGMGGRFIPSEISRHIGTALEKGIMTEAEAKNFAGIDRDRLLRNSPPAGAEITKKEKEAGRNFELDEHGIPKRTMRAYVEGKDYTAIKEGDDQYIEFTVLLNIKDHEIVANALAAIGGDWAAALVEMAKMVKTEPKAKARKK